MTALSLNQVRLLSAAASNCVSSSSSSKKQRRRREESQNEEERREFERLNVHVTEGGGRRGSRGLGLGWSYAALCDKVAQVFLSMMFNRGNTLICLMLPFPLLHTLSVYLHLSASFFSSSLRRRTGDEQLQITSCIPLNLSLSSSTSSSSSFVAQ